MTGEEYEDVEARVSRADSKDVDWCITPDDAFRALRIQLDRLADSGRRYPLDAEKMVIDRDRLATVIAIVRAAETKFKDYTRVVTLPGPIG